MRAVAVVFIIGLMAAFAAGPAWAAGASRNASPPPDLGAEFQAGLEQAQQQLQQQLAQAEAGLKAAAAAKVEEAKSAIRSQLSTAPAPVRAFGERLLADADGPAGCATNPVEFGPVRGHVSRNGSTATATITLDRPLCAPLPLTLATYSKDNGLPFPLGTQTLHDADTQTLHAAGTYTFAAALPTVGGDPCASQTDFFRSANISSMSTTLPGLEIEKILAGQSITAQATNLVEFNGGPNAFNLVDGMQLDQPAVDACNPVNPVNPVNPAPVIVGGISVSAPGSGGGTTGGAAPARAKPVVAGASGTLSRTGSDIVLPMLLAIFLILAGWMALAFRHLADDVDPRQT